MNEEMRTTLTMLGDILSAIHCNTPANLIAQFLKPSEDDGEYLSNEDLNEKLRVYLREYVNSDVDLGARMINLNGLYLPVATISKWRKESKYSLRLHRLEYRLYINENEGKVGKYDNIIVTYRSKEELEKDIEKLLEMKLTWSQ